MKIFFSNQRSKQRFRIGPANFRQVKHLFIWKNGSTLFWEKGMKKVAFYDLLSNKQCVNSNSEKLFNQISLLQGKAKNLLETATFFNGCFISVLQDSYQSKTTSFQKPLEWPFFAGLTVSINLHSHIVQMEEFSILLRVEIL